MTVPYEIQEDKGYCLLNSLYHTALENSGLGRKTEATRAGQGDVYTLSPDQGILAQTPLRWIISERMDNASSAVELSAV